MTRRDMWKMAGLGLLTAPLLHAFQKRALPIAPLEKVVSSWVPYNFSAEHREMLSVRACVRAQYSNDGITWINATHSAAQEGMRSRYVRWLADIP